MIYVFGSINFDMVASGGRMPQAGETVVCPDLELFAGGKGANQALACLRAGAKVALVSRVGEDGMGERMVAALRREGVITSGVAKSDRPTGCAFIMREDTGENRIVVASGANAEITADQLPDELLKPGVVLLMQMETPHAENWALLARAKAGGATTILNLAPAYPVPQDALKTIDYLILNEIEAEQLAAHLRLPPTDVVNTAEAIAKLGGLTCIVTLGPKGALAVPHAGTPVLVPALKLDHVVDTTGAGDCWCGTFAAALTEGRPLDEAMRRASVAGSLACIKPGAQDSFPWLGEIEEALARL